MTNTILVDDKIRVELTILYIYSWIIIKPMRIYLLTSTVYTYVFYESKSYLCIGMWVKMVFVNLIKLNLVVRFCEE